MPLPSAYHRFWAGVQDQRFADYAAGRTSWVVGLAPELAVRLSTGELTWHLRPRLSPKIFDRCLDPEYIHPSPLVGQTDGEWLKKCHTVGVNVRTIGSFWNVVKYALTLPDHVRGIHLLPIWEPGVVGSLYGMASWGLNPEFRSEEMATALPELRRTEDQLRVVINLLHAMGKVVGMDVIPHTDRYSEMVLANPAHFEWLRRFDTSIVSHREYLHEEVQLTIRDWLRERGPALTAYGMVGGLWQLPEADRLKLFFGHPDDFYGRQARRVDLVDWLYHRGLEPVPATMAPPYRGLEVDPSPDALTVDAAGRAWRDYRITEPAEMSRVFGPLARYKLYARHDDNQDWAIDFSRPRPKVWTYLTNHYAAQQARYNFDFMRGDMSHVQMRPEGVPEQADDYYDPLRAVKRKIQETTPYFAYFAESFLTPPGFMAYGDEVEHLLRSEAEVTLGNLQSTVPGSAEFWDMHQHYLDIGRSTLLTPAWTVITGDKDDPRFDHFHHRGELARLFTGLFLGVQPMYFSLGYEQRDRHFSRAPNEVYSKLYVFQESRGDKMVSGPFVWGGNLDLFARWTKLREFAAGMLAHLGDTRMLDCNQALVWLRPATDGEGAYIFAVNFAEEPLAEITVPLPERYPRAELLYATEEVAYEALSAAKIITIHNLAGARCYRLLH
ncbi:MAG: hypothetical protein AAFZ52_00095 [Bacteroidota bacterium]